MVRLARAFDFSRATNSFSRTLPATPAHQRPAGLPGKRARDLQAQWRRAESRQALLMGSSCPPTLTNLRVSFEANGVETVRGMPPETLSKGRGAFTSPDMRSSYPVAFFFHYVLTACSSSNAVLLEATRGNLRRRLARNSRLGRPSCWPSASSPTPWKPCKRRRTTPRDKGPAPRWRLTDSLVSPLAEKRRPCRSSSTTKTPSFFHSVAPAVAASEALIALIVADGGGGRAAGPRSHRKKRKPDLPDFDAYWRQRTVEIGRPRTERRPKGGAP